MKVEAKGAVLVSVERPGIPSGVIPIKHDALFRQELLGITGINPSSLEPAHKKVTMFNQPFVEVPLQQIKPEISPIEEVKKTESYNPGKRKGFIDENGRRILRRRPRRPSRCNGMHDKEADPCGSPRCRSTNRGDKSKTNNSQRIQRRRVIMNPRKRKS